MKVVVAGASGFVGKRLVRALAQEHPVIALSRKKQRSAPNVETRECDLFSLLDAERGVQGAEVAYYLVHSMMPSARLTQGSFDDFDLIAADNFSRACAKAGVKQIIYLGGLIPEKRPLSTHLKSRLEVEEALAAHEVPVTALRAGLILGAGGSSFLMMTRLVRRLPVMLCPKWTRMRTQPVALDEVVELLRYCLLNPRTFAQNFDIGADEVVSYQELMRRCAETLGFKRTFVSVRLLSPGLSRLWVSLITGAPKALVAPLIQSLRADMVCHDRRLQEMGGTRSIGIDEALATAVRDEGAAHSATPVSYQVRENPADIYDVRSVQRLPLPDGKDAHWIADEYMRVLPKLIFWMIRVEVDADGGCTFYLRFVNFVLLKLRLSKDRSSEDRQLFYLNGGLLTLGENRGRLEFRSFPRLHVVIAAIHDFRPRLPWFIYRESQARVHLWVMKRFGRYLLRRIKAAKIQG